MIRPIRSLRNRLYIKQWLDLHTTKRIDTLPFEGAHALMPSHLSKTINVRLDACRCMPEAQAAASKGKDVQGVGCMMWVALNDALSAIDESRPHQVQTICPSGH